MRCNSCVWGDKIDTRGKWLCHKNYIIILPNSQFSEKCEDWEPI